MTFTKLTFAKPSLLAAAMAACVALPTAAAAEWPDRSVRFIIPFGPAGGGDMLGRFAADALREAFGQPFVPENIPGASTVIGITQLVNSEPDGYTLAVANVSSTVIAPVTNPNVTYDPNEDLTYIAMLAGAPTVIAVNAGLGITTIDELLDAARAASRPFAYGTQGTATMTNLAPTLFFQEVGVEVQHIPYGGAGEAVADAVAGHIQFTAATLSTARAQIDEGTLIPLVISTAERHPDFPDMPTFAEIGYPHLTSAVWWGIVGPAGMDPEVVQQINTAIIAALDEPEVAERHARQGFIYIHMTPEEFLAYQLEQFETFGPVAATMVE